MTKIKWEKISSCHMDFEHGDDENPLFPTQKRA